MDEDHLAGDTERLFYSLKQATDRVANGLLRVRGSVPTGLLGLGQPGTSVEMLNDNFTLLLVGVAPTIG